MYHYIQCLRVKLLHGFIVMWTDDVYNSQSSYLTSLYSRHVWPGIRLKQVTSLTATKTQVDNVYLCIYISIYNCTHFMHICRQHQQTLYTHLMRISVQERGTCFQRWHQYVLFHLKWLYSLLFQCTCLFRKALALVILMKTIFVSFIYWKM